MPYITDSMTNSPVFCYYGTQGLLMLMQLDLKRTCAIADVLFLSMCFSLRALNYNTPDYVSIQTWNEDFVLFKVVYMTL